MRSAPVALAACLTLLLPALVTPPGAQAAPVQRPPVQLPRERTIPTSGTDIVAFQGNRPQMRLPDLVVEIDGPERAIAGEHVSLTVTLRNQGTAPAPGTVDAPNTSAYQADLVLSQDATVRVEPATDPAKEYWYTPDDFVEDMLVEGGRIDDTKTLAAGASDVRTIDVPIPAKTEPGMYNIAAVVDTWRTVEETDESNNVYMHKIQIGIAPMPPVDPPPNSGTWVMPWGVGGTRLDEIREDGLTRCGYMQDCPFGSRLGLRLVTSSDLPTDQAMYYRWLYRRQGTSAWTELTESVTLHYTAQKGGTWTYPAYLLGPKSVNNKNLYEFRPQSPPAPTGGTAWWPQMDWLSDPYSGTLDTRGLPDGKYQIKLEVHKSNGAIAVPGTDFEFIVPTTVKANGHLGTKTAPGADIQGNGYVFTLHVDNSPCGARLEDPWFTAPQRRVTDGVLFYDGSQSELQLAFNATHPSGFAYFRFRVWWHRVSYDFIRADGDVNAPKGPNKFSGNGRGYWHSPYSVAALAGDPKPRVSTYHLDLHTMAKATNGWSQVIEYDAWDSRSFTLVPTTGVK